MPEDGRPIAPVVVKKYANRRLYDTESSIYITLDTLAEMVRHGRDFVVYDAKTGDDITRAVLTQIIMEEEVRGRNMLPTVFLRQLIGFYGDSRQGQVPDYLEHMMEQFINQQHPAPAKLLPAFLRPVAVPDREMAGSHEPAVMDHAISLFSPAYRPGHDLGDLVADTMADLPQAMGGAGSATQDGEDVAALHREIGRLRQALAKATAGMNEPAGLLQAAGGSGRH